jgi:arginine metabolism regulation protein II
LLDTNAGSRYSLKDIDGYLLALDSDSLEGAPATTIKGPFCMFPTLELSEDNSNTRNPVVLTYPNQANTSSDALFPHNLEIPAISHGAHVTDSDSPTNIVQGKPVLDTDETNLDPVSNASDLQLEEYDYLYDFEDTSMTTISSLSISSLTSGISSSYGFSILPMDRISTSLFNNPFVDMLMHHYITNVSDILLPVRHARNPYRNIYAPAALEVVYNSTPTSRVNFALYNSLLASSAFHLWHCNPALGNYFEIGAEYNERAVRHLRSSISSNSLTTTEYRNLLMTILSLVDNSVGHLINPRIYVSPLNNSIAIHRWKVEL